MSTLKIAAIQYDIAWLDISSNLKRLEQLMETLFAENSGIDLLLLPEAFATGFCVDKSEIEEPPEGGVIVEWLRQQAQRYQCVVAGSVLMTQLHKKVNRFLWVSPNSVIEYYDKRHLFRMGSEHLYVSPGMERKILTLNGINIIPQVCYDLRFPVWSRNRQDYDLMINVANWPAVRATAWEALLKARAIENQCFVVGLNRVGVDGRGSAHIGGSAIYDYLGEPVVKAADGEQQTLVATLNFSELEAFRHKFPVHRDADQFELME